MKTDSKKIKTIFMGTPDFAVPILNSLINNDNIDLVSVVTQPDKPVGRKKELTPPPVKLMARQNNIDVMQPAKINNDNFIKKINEINPDMIIVAAYGKILPKKIIDLPKFGCINVHASLLPNYRGASPIQTAILNGEKETGITIMKMDEGLDTGDMISQESILIDDLDTSQSLHDKLSKLGAELLIKTLPDYITETTKPTPQDGKQATYCKILTREDGKIDFSKTASQINNKLRAFTPWPGIYTFFKEKKLKILEIEIDETINPLISVGKIYTAEDKLLVNCGDATIVLKKVQMEGKKCASGADFVRGYLG